ncbi:hypothetical protein JHK82_029873 [Glycine max]|uniref:Uncharacterized protein n=1 Tax=Glycine max TaxID=3847 RepID=K7LMQ1_SOYBN|nr:hypothetical protein JHK85_030487 [Glycine max]KAG4993128.1 hypothetical protein JHK86_029955 [Glycine max]KAG5123136.1 hypothetical protein JHK82_029873 [Glycine max]KAG5144550.1 hypothetical protein JHK84_030093 [Glycine max]KAH1157211.1 hypothetical protein GYH30_029813 [Glycine max]
MACIITMHLSSKHFFSFPLILVSFKRKLCEWLVQDQVASIIGCQSYVKAFIICTSFLHFSYSIQYLYALNKQKGS